MRRHQIVEVRTEAILTVILRNAGSLIREGQTETLSLHVGCLIRYMAGTGAIIAAGNRIPLGSTVDQATPCRSFRT